MKTLYSLLSFLILFQFTYAHDSVKTVKCRKNLKSFNQVDKAAAWTSDDLISGNWVAEGNFGSYRNAEQITLQFNQNGSVEIFITDVFGRTEHESEWWDISTVRNQVYLSLDDLNENKMYRVQPNCKGMMIKDIVSGEEILLDFIPRKTNNELSLMKTQLHGTWKSMEYPFELTNSMDDCGTFKKMEDASFEISFEEDGTFIRSLANKMVSVDEQGVWELSDDGQYLTLYFTKTDDPESVYGKTIVELKYLGLQDLWMKQSIESVAFQSMFCTPTKVFSMEKQPENVEMIR